MRHRKATVKLGRTSSHRRAMMSNLATSLFDKERITTTLPKAKALRSQAERLITKARQDTLHARRLVGRTIHDKRVLRKLFDQLSPRYADRPGGYTRIYRLGWRKGDNAEMAIIELVDRAGTTAASDDASAGRKLVEREDDSERDAGGDDSSSESKS